MGVLAPEQARGKPVDQRADIWAFGVVLYEMLTGRRAFEGEDGSSVLAAVLQSEPRWDGVPATVRRLLESCLEKDPRRRLRDIGDVWKLLDDAPAAPSRSRIGIVGWITGGLLAVVAAMALWAPWRSASPSTAQPLVRLDVDLGPDVSLAPLVAPTFSSVVISPDGTRLVYVGSVSGGPPRLFARRLDQSQSHRAWRYGGRDQPFLFPRRAGVGFWDGRGIAKISLEGGPVVQLASMPVMTGGTWGDDGDLVIGSGIPSSTGLLRIPSTGGAPAPMLELASGETFHIAPRLLPGDKSVLSSAIGTPPSRITPLSTSSRSPIAAARLSREEAALRVTYRAAI